jgi:hypothetical protein
LFYKNQNSDKASLKNANGNQVVSGDELDEAVITDDLRASKKQNKDHNIFSDDDLKINKN